MNFFSYLRVELRRISHSGTARLMAALTLLCPLAGYRLYQPIEAETVSDHLVGNPALAGALGGTVLFALLTLLESDRVRKNRTDALTDSIVSPLVLNAARVLALGIAAFVTVLIAALVYFPYTFIKMGNVFDFSTYLCSFFILILPALLIAILAAASFYQIFNRADLSFVLFIAFVLLSYSQWFAPSFILRWVNPITPVFSDDFSNAMVFRMMAYNRIFWFAALGGLWLLTLLCTRRYGRRLPGSFVHGLKKVYIPVLAAALIGFGCYAYVYQPFIDHSPVAANPAETVMVESNPNQNVTLSHTDLSLTFYTFRGALSGKAVFTLQNTSGTEQKCKMDLNPGFTVRKVTADGQEVSFQDLHNDTDGTKQVTFTMPAKPEVQLSVEYDGSPRIWALLRQYLLSTIISDKCIDLQAKELHPMLEVADYKDGNTIDSKLTMPAGLTPVATGDTLKMISENPDHTRTWSAHNDGSSLWLMAGDYVMKKLNSGGIPVEFYYSAKHAASMEKLSADKIMESTLAYGTKHYGSLVFATPERPVKVVQGTAFHFGGWMGDNFSVMGETFFSDSNLNDPIKGASSAEVLAHEIAHQWWHAQCTDKKNPEWSGEGLTVYTTYRMMKEKFGEEYAKKNYVDVWKSKIEERKRNFYNRHPEYLSILPPEYTVDLTKRNTTVDTYCVTPLKIYKATELVGGEEKMDKILAGLYQKGGTETPPYITYNDFLKACGLSKEELNLD